jgi:heme exporter protein D
MPDLGEYAFAVLASYGVTLILVAGLVGLTIRQRARVARQLAEVEARMAPRDDA